MTQSEFNRHHLQLLVDMKHINFSN